MPDTARTGIREAVLTALRAALRDTHPLPAETVGSVYKEVADAHRGDQPCPCGWRARLTANLEALQTALALNAASHPRRRPC